MSEVLVVRQSSAVPPQAPVPTYSPNLTPSHHNPNFKYATPARLDEPVESAAPVDLQPGVGRVEEKLVVEISAATRDPEVCTERSTEAPPAETQAACERKIHNLWNVHCNLDNSSKSTRHELKEVREELGRQLHFYKKRYARTGRKGGWRTFVKMVGMSLATADRYVGHHEHTINPKPTKTPKLNSAGVSSLANKTAAKLLPKLLNEAQRQHFLAEMSKAFASKK